MRAINYIPIIIMIITLITHSQLALIMIINFCLFFFLSNPIFQLVKSQMLVNQIFINIFLLGLFIQFEMNFYAELI